LRWSVVLNDYRLFYYSKLRLYMLRRKRYRLMLLGIKIVDVIMERKEFKRLENDYYDFTNRESNKDVDSEEDKG